MTDALALGATLYLPATRPDLVEVALGGRVPGLRSCVICLEDSVRVDALPEALARVAALLARLRHAPQPLAPLVFVRPRDPAMLGHVLRMPGADRLSGFVLPKVSADTLPDWLALPFAPGQGLMPTLETAEAFDSAELRRLRDQLLAIRERVLCVRIGGNDLLQCLGLRRPERRTLYEGPLGPMIATIAGIFLPHGIAVSAPVMERFDDPVLLRAEMERDLEHGLTSKTAIHPAQLPVIQGALAVGAAELAEAASLLEPDAAAVFAQGGRMCEPATHWRWAESIVRRAALFGVAEPLPRARLG